MAKYRQEKRTKRLRKNTVLEENVFAQSRGIYHLQGSDYNFAVLPCSELLL